jgi:hypothetical protein
VSHPVELAIRQLLYQNFEIIKKTHSSHPCFEKNLTNMAVARQRIGEHILEVTQSTVGPPLLSNRLFRFVATDNSQIIIY